MGLLGLFGVARHAGLERNMLEMDTVLGKADIRGWRHIMVPVYGPTTTRGWWGYHRYRLASYALLTFPLRVVRWALDGLGTRARNSSIRSGSSTTPWIPYALTKDFYLQVQRQQVTGRKYLNSRQQKSQGRDDGSNLDDYMDRN